MQYPKSEIRNPQSAIRPVGLHRYSRTEILNLKTRWVPLLLVGTILLAASGGILFILAYRRLNALFSLTPRFFGFWESLPARSLAFTLGIVLGIVGLVLTVYALDRIRASEIGHIRSLSWKIAVALFASRWWFRSPSVVVLGSGEGLCIALRALKSFTHSVTALVPAVREGWEAWQPYFLALAAREEALGELLAWELPRPEGTVALSALVADHLSQANGNLPEALSTLSQALAVEGTIIPLTPEAPLPAPTLTALREADAILIGPGDLEGDILPVLIPLAGVLRSSTARKFFIAPVAVPRREGRVADLSEVVSTIHQATDGLLLDVVLVNTNLAPPLPDPDLAYLVVDKPALQALGIEVVGRDLVDWSVPTRHDIHKLAAWLQDVVSSS